MFERYSDKVGHAITLARHEAVRFGDSEIKSHHMLLALLQDNESLEFLLNIEEGLVRSKIEIRHPISLTAPLGTLPMSDEGKRIMGYAAQEAEQRGDRMIERKHLFVGIFLEENCSAAEILREFKLSIKLVRRILWGQR